MEVVVELRKRSRVILIRRGATVSFPNGFCLLIGAIYITCEAGAEGYQRNHHCDSHLDSAPYSFNFHGEPHHQLESVALGPAFKLPKTQIQTQPLQGRTAISLGHARDSAVAQK